MAAQHHLLGGIQLSEHAGAVEVEALSREQATADGKEDDERKLDPIA